MGVSGFAVDSGIEPGLGDFHGTSAGGHVARSVVFDSVVGPLSL